MQKAVHDFGRLVAAEAIYREESDHHWRANQTRKREQVIWKPFIAWQSEWHAIEVCNSGPVGDPKQCSSTVKSKKHASWSEC